ncbi:unnamed protein product [Timema podura]|uniref:Uncharacterized protein n=1 Tax=Timema podura TaxID=61482 RepID=A0ABN7NGQ4_TIMPD|nr:unnamed protein product [Timema podura]
MASNHNSDKNVRKEKRNSDDNKESKSENYSHIAPSSASRSTNSSNSTNKFNKTFRYVHSSCYICNGYYGPCFEEPVCATCHAFLFPDYLSNSEALAIFSEKTDDGDSGNDEPTDYYGLERRQSQQQIPAAPPPQRPPVPPVASSPPLDRVAEQLDLLSSPREPDDIVPGLVECLPPEVQKEGHNVTAKNLKGATHANLEQDMLEGFSEHRGQNVLKNGPMMQRKADEFSLRDLERIVTSWRAVRQVVIADCFRHAHFVLLVNEETSFYILPTAASAEDPDDRHLAYQQPFICPPDFQSAVRRGNVAEISPDCTYEEYLAADNDIIVWGSLDNADIIREQQESSDEEGQEEMEEEPEYIPTTKDILKAGDVYSRSLMRQGASEELLFQFYNAKDCRANWR